MKLKRSRSFKNQRSIIQRWLLKRNFIVNKKQSIVVYVFFNSFITINYYLIFFSKILLKSFFLLNLYKFNNIKVTENIFLNSNLYTTITKNKLICPNFFKRDFFILKKYKNKKKKKIFIKKKKIKSLIFPIICNFFFWPVTNFFINLYEKYSVIKTYYSYTLSIKKWFNVIHSNETSTININNILIYMSEIFNSIKYASKFYLNDLFSLYKKNRLLLQILSFLCKFNKYKLLYLVLIKKKKKFYNKLNKIYINYKNSFLKIYNKYLFNTIKIYFSYINTFNINKINILYSKFSFLLKKKIKKKKKNIFLKKRFNFIFLLNNWINKFMYFIFLYWINIFLKFITFDNVYFFKKFNTFLLINHVYQLYYEKKRNKIMLKSRFLKYYKPCLFLLYLKNFNFNLTKIKNDNQQ